MRKGKDDGLRDLERKAMQVGVDEDGGYAVPEELDRTIINLLKDEVVMRQRRQLSPLVVPTIKSWLTLAAPLPAGSVKLMPALRLLHLNSVRLNRSWVKSTETLRQPRRCWMMLSLT